MCERDLSAHEMKILNIARDYEKVVFSLKFRFCFTVRLLFFILVCEEIQLGHHPRSALSLFLYFSISFFIKIYFCFRNLQEYTPAAPLPGGRSFFQKVSQKICTRAPGGPVARQRGGRPPKPPCSGAARSGRPAAGRPPPIPF